MANAEPQSAKVLPAGVHAKLVEPEGTVPVDVWIDQQHGRAVSGALGTHSPLVAEEMHLVTEPQFFQPFTWTAKAETILAKVRRAREVLDKTPSV
jgi:hypothetical protein